MLANKMQLTVRPTIFINCPRCAEEVYSLGVKLMDYLGQTYMDLAGDIREPQRTTLLRLANRYFENKSVITNLINADLNRELGYFYEHGGPVMKPPVTELNIKDIQPFFNKTISNFFSQSDAMVYITGKGEMSISELERETYQYIIGLYNILGRLYQVAEVREAFSDLVRIEMSNAKHS